MMKLLYRYVARQFLVTFITLVLGLPLLFVITDITDNLDKYLGRGLSIREVALSYLYQIPLFVLYAFPIAALVATVFTIGNMTRHQEITAAKAGGISFFRLLSPIIALGALLSVIALGLGELVPVTNQMRAEILGDRASQSMAFRSDFVFQTEREGVLSIRRLDPGAREMTGVLLERQATATAPGLHETAERAVWKPGEGWRFEDGYLRIFGQEGEERTFAFSALRIPALRETPEELLAEPKEPEEMRYADMTRFIGAIERSGGDARPMIVERAQKIALPMAVLVIILFGAPLATSSKRGGTAYGVGISLAVTMIYLLLFRIGKAVGSSGTLDPILAAWMPNALFLVAGLILLSRVRT
jgi:lipopolysaccharide export system permease protein